MRLGRKHKAIRRQLLRLVPYVAGHERNGCDTLMIGVPVKVELFDTADPAALAEAVGEFAALMAKQSVLQQIGKNEVIRAFDG